MNELSNELAALVAAYCMVFGIIYFAGSLVVFNRSTKDVTPLGPYVQGLVGFESWNTFLISISVLILMLSGVTTLFMVVLNTTFLVYIAATASFKDSVKWCNKGIKIEIAKQELNKRITSNESSGLVGVLALLLLTSIL